MLSYYGGETLKLSSPELRFDQLTTWRKSRGTYRMRYRILQGTGRGATTSNLAVGRAGWADAGDCVCCRRPGPSHRLTADCILQLPRFLTILLARKVSVPALSFDLLPFNSTRSPGFRSVLPDIRE